MKHIIILILCLVVSKVYSQEIKETEIKSSVNEVTVFLEGAQITRKKEIDVVKGKTILKFTSLSPFIDAKSVQVKAEGLVTVLSVNHQQNYLDKLKKPQEVSILEEKLKEIEDAIKFEKAYMSITEEELAFLKENRNIGGRNEELSATNFREASNFYGSKLKELKIRDLDLRKKVKSLTDQKNKLTNQINTLTSKKEYSVGEVLVKIDAKQSGKATFEISYVVGNAGWFPTYDIRAKNINEPIELVYKANVRQDTKVDWKDVKLKFSSSDPNVSGVAPDLQTYYLRYNTPRRDFRGSISSVRGRVVDGHTNEGLPGANVVVNGTTIGTATDLNGNYSIAIPKGASQLNYAFIGYETQAHTLSNSVMNVSLIPDLQSLDEIVVVGYGTRHKKNAASALQGKVAGLTVSASEIKVRGVSTLAQTSKQVAKLTTVDFEIKTPYTINSDNKSYSVDMSTLNLAASYQYYCVPKMNREAFLIASVTDWEKYNLLEGEANIFFEETYIGKTLLDLSYAADTLKLSLGRDKNVTVNREKITDFTSKQFIGSKKEETRAWTTTIKNNKSQEISMLIVDQVPVSTLEEIEVDIQKISGAKLNSDTGELKWEFKLEPSDQKELELKYSVKYPKNKNLIIE